MTNEEKIVSELVRRFPQLAEKTRIQRERRIFTETPQKDFEDIITYAMKNIGFTMLCTITGLDEGEVFSLLYHFADEKGHMLNIKISVPKSAPVVKTVTGYFPTANIYERELNDLFGIEIDGLPAGKRYPLPDNWPKGDHPLRKDWQPKAKEGKGA